MGNCILNFVASFLLNKTCSKKLKFSFGCSFKCLTSDVLYFDKSRPLLEDSHSRNVFLGNIYDMEVYSMFEINCLRKHRVKLHKESLKKNTWRSMVGTNYEKRLSKLYFVPVTWGGNYVTFFFYSLFNIDWFIVINLRYWN